MSGSTFGSLPLFAGGEDPSLSPALQGWLQDQRLAQAQGAVRQDVPQATPPGFTGFAPQTPPTGAPTPVVQPGAASLAGAAMDALGPSGAQAATPDGGDIRGRFIGALQAGGLTNPNGLGAVAAYAQHESRYSPQNITGSWSDPSESGQPGTSGGILSWRGDRLANMRAFTQGASDPVTAQAQFTLAENPALTQALQSAGSPEEAHRLMADAWRFAGYNRPGGENAARLASTQDYAARLAGGQALPTMSGPTGQTPGAAAPLGATMGATAQRGGFGLGGIEAQGGPVAGQSSPAPGVASLSGQPFTVDGAPAAQQPASPYAAVAGALKSLAGQQQRQGQQQGRGASFPAIEGGGRAISLQQARAMFDPGKFYSLLQAHGLKAPRA